MDVVEGTQTRQWTANLRTVSGTLLRHREISIALVAVVVVVVFWLQNSAFAGLDEMSVILRDTGQFGVIAAALVPVMITGEIDLSVAKTFGLAPFIMYFAVKGIHVPIFIFWGPVLSVPGLPLVVGFVLAVLVGVLVGLFNGLVTVKLRVPSLITTLGTLFFLNGLTQYMSGSQQVTTPAGEPFDTYFGENLYTPGTGFHLSFFSAISPFIWAVVAVAAITYVLRKTTFGMHTIAVGSNLVGARELGIRADRVKIINFMVAGGLAAFIGVVEAVRSTSTDPSAGDNSLTLAAIAAAVIGGTALLGGTGTAIGALIGCFVVASLQNGLPLVGAQATVSDMILGAAILIAMVLNLKVSDFRARRAQ
jgi:simple sugar transport system permease protein